MGAVFSSPLKRAVQTGRIAFPMQTIRIEKGFHERIYGELDGLKWSDIQKRFPKAHAAYHRDRSLPGIHGAEKLSNLRKRAKKTLTKILKKFIGKNIAVIGHGQLNKALTAELIGWTNRKIAQTHLANSAVTVLEFEKQKWRMASLHEKTANPWN